MLSYIKSDLARKSGNYILTGGFIEKYIMTSLQPGTIATLIYRFGAWTEQQTPLLAWLTKPIYHLMDAVGRSVSGISIDKRTPIGFGFIIHNFSSIRIDAERIGDNLTINQGVTIGPDWRNDGKPQLGNNVFVGSGAKVLGAVTIGDNVVVAANALVISSIPDNCTVVGVPARIIAREGTSSYLQLKK